MSSQADAQKLTDVLVGPMLIGTVLNVWLLGLMYMQCYTYFYTRNKDPRWIRLLVAFLLLADTVNSIFDIVFTYQYSVKLFGDLEAIQRATWVFNTDPVMTVIISSTVQAFFAWRVGRLTGQMWLAVLIALSALIQFFCGLGTSIACGIVIDFVKFQKFKSIVIVWLVLAPVTDAAITFSLVWYLRQHRTGFRGTDDIVSRVIRLTVQTGMITAIWAVVDLIIYLIYPNNYHLILNMPLAKLYTNCLMSSLNARGQWSSSSYDHETPSQGPRGGIQVTTTTGIHRDHYELEATSGHKLDGSFAPRFTSNPTVSRAGGHVTSTHGFPTDTKRHVQLDDGLSLRSDDASSTEGKVPSVDENIVEDGDRKVEVVEFGGARA